MNSHGWTSSIKLYLLAAQISGIKPPLSLPHLASSPPSASLTIHPSRASTSSFDQFRSSTHFDLQLPFLFKMQTKIFLTSLLATFLAVGVTATPAGVKARDDRTSHAVEFSKVATSLGNVKPPPPTGQTITPKDKDVPVASTSVKARDLVSSKLSSTNWAGRQTNFYNRRALKRELLDVFT